MVIYIENDFEAFVFCVLKEKLMTDFIPIIVAGTAFDDFIKYILS